MYLVHPLITFFLANDFADPFTSWWNALLHELGRDEVHVSRVTPVLVIHGVLDGPLWGCFITRKSLSCHMSAWR